MWALVSQRMYACVLLPAMAAGLNGGCGPEVRRGVLVLAHGGNPEWNAAVEVTVEPLRARYPVEVAYGMGRPSTIRAGIRALEQQGVQEIAVVRLFISADSFRDRIDYILGLRSNPRRPARVAGGGEFDGVQGRRGARVVGAGSPDADLREGAVVREACVAGGALDSQAGHVEDRAGDHGHAHTAAYHSQGGPQHAGGGHVMEPLERVVARATLLVSDEGVCESPLVEEILLDRVRALSVDPARESVLLLAHGPGDDAENERWLARMRERAARIFELGPFRAVRCETLREDWPERRAEAERRIRQFVSAGSRDGGRVLVVPFRIAGFGPYAEVLAGLEYVADGRGLCPHPNMTRWIAEAAERCFARSGGCVEVRGVRCVE